MIFLPSGIHPSGKASSQCSLCHGQGICESQAWKQWNLNRSIKGVAYEQIAQRPDEAHEWLCPKCYPGGKEPDSHKPKHGFAKGNYVASQKPSVAEEMIGATYGKLTVREILKNEQHIKRGAYILCDCSCGTKGFKTLAARVRYKETQSCGCLQKERSQGRPRRKNSIPCFNKKAVSHA